MLLTWEHFMPFAIVASLLWAAGALAALFPGTAGRRLCACSTALGIVVYAAFVAGLWMSLDRPPLRTMGETRLWYTLFMVASGWAVYMKWRYRWIPLMSFVVATVFVAVNILHPEIHDRSLMPALQSEWFVPHVTVYMFSYSIFGCAFLLAIAGLWRHTDDYLASTDRLVDIGLMFLTFGMLSGCIWAKQAWGTYWSWDPKETWAAATWCVYLMYIHYRLPRTAPQRAKWPYALLIIGFLLLQMCWYGINYLPSAQGSLHRY